MSDELGPLWGLPGNSHRRLWRCTLAVICAVLLMVTLLGLLRAFSINRASLQVFRRMAHPENNTGPARSPSWPLAALPERLSAQVALANGDSAEGARLLEHHLSTHPHDDLSRYKLGQTYALQGDLSAAQSVWREGQDIHRHFLFQVMAMLEQSEFSAALAAAQMLQDWSPYPSSALHVQGMAYRGLDEDDRAITSFEQALESATFDPTVISISRSSTYYELGRLAIARRDWPLAKASFESLLDADPTNTYALVNLGFVHLNGYGDTGSAHDSFAQALSYSESEWAHVGLSRVYYREGATLMSAQEMLKAIQVHPTSGFVAELTRRIALLPDEQGKLLCNDATDALRGNPALHDQISGYCTESFQNIGRPASPSPVTDDSADQPAQDRPK